MLVALLIPMHWGVFSYFYAFLFWINVFGHMNFDFWPQGLYRWPYGSLFMTPTHHSFHHEYKTKNYGLYYRFWDEFCGTMNEATYPHFYELKKNHRPGYLDISPLSRPDPKNIIGLYFEQIDRFGEDVMINWDVEGKNYLFHHAGDDGTSSFHKILNNYKIRCEENPSFIPRPKLSFFTKIYSILRLYSRIPHTCSIIKKSLPKNSSRKTKSIYFTKNETKKILEKAEGAGVNGFFIYHLSQILAPKLKRKKQMWMAPVNTNLPGETIANEVSNVDVIFDGESISPEGVKRLIKREIDLGMIYSGKFFI